MNQVLNYATFGGTKYNEATYCYISWSSASVITIYVGANGYANCPRIYAKGATQDQIAAWQAAGKTIVQVS